MDPSATSDAASMMIPGHRPPSASSGGGASSLRYSTRKRHTPSANSTNSARVRICSRSPNRVSASTRTTPAGSPSAPHTLMPSALAVFTTSTYASPSSDTSASAPNPIHHESRDHASTASCDARRMRGGGRHAARQISRRNSIRATRPPIPTISIHRALTAQTDVSAGPLAPPAPPRYGAPMGTSPTANTAAPPTMWPSADTTRHRVV